MCTELELQNAIIRRRRDDKIKAAEYLNMFAKTIAYPVRAINFSPRQNRSFSLRYRRSFKLSRGKRRDAEKRATKKCVVKSVARFRGLHERSCQVTLTLKTEEDRLESEDAHVENNRDVRDKGSSMVSKKSRR